MKAHEIFNKTLASYDSWNGDHETVRVRSIEITEDEKEIIFIGEGYWKNEARIYIPLDCFDELLEKGNITISNTIDHCSVYKEIKFI